MEPKPVQDYAAPKYPTRRDLMLGAAGFVLIDLLGGSDASGAENAKPAAERTVVAPIFKHGEGRGATGCIVIAPPVFLSEEEAMQIIREELATKHGVKLGDPMTIADVKITARVIQFEVEEKDGKRELKERVEVVEEDTTPLKLNGVDRQKKIAVRFVSKKAYCDLGGPQSCYRRATSSGPTYVLSTVQPYDFHEVAQYVAAQVKKQSKSDLYVGLLYDPVYKLDSRALEPIEALRLLAEHYKEAEARRKAEVRDLLRQQCRDFAAWLKQQKVL